MANKITIQEIERAQQVWAAKITEIGKALLENQDYQKAAKNLVDELYGYQTGAVLFKPTKAKKMQFRLNAESALSYFIGNNVEYEEDKGFALKPWQSVRFENAGFILKENFAVAMGNYFFSDYEGREIKVEYTIGYYRSTTDSLKINLHHSSLPYSGD